MRQIKYACTVCGVNVRRRATSLDGMCEGCTVRDWAMILESAFPPEVKRVQRFEVWDKLEGKGICGNPNHGRLMTEAMVKIGFVRPYKEADWRRS